METLDEYLRREYAGYSYSRYEARPATRSKSCAAALRSGTARWPALAGMSALHRSAVLAALTDRRQAAFWRRCALRRDGEPAHERARADGRRDSLFVDVCDLAAVEKGGERRTSRLHPDGDDLKSTAARGLDRGLGEIREAAGARAGGGSTTFATPLLASPLELGRTIVAHSVTKYLAGSSGTCWAAIAVSDEAHLETNSQPVENPGAGVGAVRELSHDARHQDVSAAHGTASAPTPVRVASWLAGYIRASSGSIFPETRRILTRLQYASSSRRACNGAIVSFELKGGAAGMYSASWIRSR
jgi:hypothetical protein